MENINENNNNKYIVRNVRKTKTCRRFNRSGRRKLQLKVDIFTSVATKVQRLLDPAGAAKFKMALRGRVVCVWVCVGVCECVGELGE